MNKNNKHIKTTVTRTLFEKLDESIAAKKNIYYHYKAAIVQLFHLTILNVINFRTLNCWLDCANMLPKPTVKPNNKVKTQEKVNMHVLVSSKLRKQA